MFEEEIAKSCQPASSKLLRTGSINNYLTLENPDPLEIFLLILDLILLP